MNIAPISATFIRIILLLALSLQFGCKPWPGWPDDDNGTPIPISDIAYCICSKDGDDTNVIVYFDSKPLQFNTFGKVKITSNSCKLVDVCPIIGPNEQRKFITGSYWIVAASWTVTEPPGRPYYELDGKIDSHAASRTSPRVVSSIPNGFSVDGASISRCLDPSAEAKSVPPLDCSSECSTPAHPLCLVSPAPNQYRQALRTLVQKISNHATVTLSRKDLMKLFDVTQDPCNRGDTTIANGKLVNEGAPGCVINSEVTTPTGQTSVKIQIPAKIHARVEYMASGALRLEFDQSVELPMLAIGDPDLNDEFGGSIYEIVGSQSSAMVRTNACLSVRWGS